MSFLLTEIPREIVDFTLFHSPFPVNAIYQTSFWQNSTFKFILPSDSCFDRAMTNIQTRLTNWSFNDFVHHYAETSPIFCAVQNDMKNYYYDIKNSSSAILRLLKYQLNIEYDDFDFQCTVIKEFLESLYNICEKKIPKCNTFYIFSPPSAGKNWFIDMVSSFYLNVGNIANYNKNSQFPFQDAVNRRMNIWNEPNFMPSAEDTIKMLTAGDTMAVNVKFKNAVTLYRTPLIVMTNNHVFRGKAFEDRVLRNTWKAAPFMKEYDKKPHPLTWPYLLKKFKIVEIGTETSHDLFEIAMDFDDKKVYNENDNDLFGNLFINEEEV